ncbi:MAG: hypothetical protein JXM70_17580 [Pirellulales bacterium]|nr:hypothetical protein [Pirellulales bacterium]
MKNLIALLSITILTVSIFAFENAVAAALVSTFENAVIRTKKIDGTTVEKTVPLVKQSEGFYRIKTL